MLTLQFHDILPGSSIGWVHREAEETHARLIAELEELIETALDALRPLETASTDPSGGQPVANAAPFDRDEVVVVDAAPRWYGDERSGTGGAPAAQRRAGGGVGDRPPHSVSAAQSNEPVDEPVAVATNAGGVTVVDNGLVRVTVDARRHGLVVPPHRDRVGR